MSDYQFFDPGVTTGFASFRRMPSGGATRGYQPFPISGQANPNGRLVFRSSQDLPLEGIWSRLDLLVNPSEVSLVVFEQAFWRTPSFVPTGMEVIGGLKYLSDRRGIRIDSQPPSILQGVMQWPFLKLTSLTSQHQKDAVAHGIMYGLRHHLQVELPKEFFRSPS